MKRLLLYLFRLFPRRQPAPIVVTTGCMDDLVSNVYKIIAEINQATCTAALDDCTDRTCQLVKAFSHLSTTCYHAARLHNRILIRRCDILTAQYHRTS